MREQLSSQGAGDGGANKLWGGPGDGEDTLFGVGGGDTLYGEAGADYLVDGGGADELFGMAGDDDLHISNDGAVDSAHCGDGDDAVADGAGGVDPTDSVDGDCEIVAILDPEEEL